MVLRRRKKTERPKFTLGMIITACHFLDINRDLTFCSGARFYLPQSFAYNLWRPASLIAVQRNADKIQQLWNGTHQHGWYSVRTYAWIWRLGCEVGLLSFLISSFPKDLLKSITKLNHPVIWRLSRICILEEQSASLLLLKEEEQGKQG